MYRATRVINKRKVVLFLVEGASDETALSYGVRKLYKEIDENSEVFFLTLHDDRQDCGDITSKYGIEPGNVEQLVGDLFIRDFIEKEGLQFSEIAEIVQIVTKCCS